MSAYTRLTPKMALRLANPKSWVASVMPTLFGIFFSILLDYGLMPYQAVALILACVLMQASVNTLNDYYDFISGADTLNDKLEKNDAVLLHNNLNPKSILALGYAFLILGCAFGIIGCISAGYTPIIIGSFGGLIVLLYSFGKYSISYLPIGELISGFTMGGLIPLGVAASADGNIHYEILIYATPLMLGIALIMMSNNGCDIEKDKLSGRTTLPIIMGRATTLFTYRLLVLLWIAIIVTLPIFRLHLPGLLSLIIITIFNKPFINLFKLKLLPDNRIEQMKTVVIANMVGNGAYILPFAASIIIKVLSYE